MSAALLEPLWHATLAASIAIVVMLAFRRPLRRFGAELAYAAWLAVPLAALAALLPRIPGAPTIVGPLPRLGAIVVDAAGASPSSGDWSGAIATAWLAGVLFAAAAFARQQRRYVRALALEPSTDAAPSHAPRRALGAGAGPATIGAFSPLIVIPSDFERRYDALERRLVLAHEEMHVARRDGLANAALVALRCVFWFDPLVHVAARRVRFDQELACDAAVLRRWPGARRAYAEAMLKTQLAVPGLPVGCHWQSSQPLKERILMLKAGQVSTARRRTGAGVVAMLLGVLAVSSYAAQSGADAPAPAAAVESPVGYASIKRIAYPAAALAAREHGIVYARIRVGADGHVLEAVPDPESTQPAKVLQDAVIAGVMDWRFEPARRDGVAVESLVVVPVTFSLDGDPDPAVPEAEGTLDAIQIRGEPEKR